MRITAATSVRWSAGPCPAPRERSPRRRAGGVAFVLAFVLAPTTAKAEREHTFSLVLPGGGILTTDGPSSIPLELVAAGKAAISRAQVTARLGKVSGVEVLAPDLATDRVRIAFFYTPPRRKDAAQEIFEVTAVTEERELADSLSVAIGPRDAPPLELRVTPPVLAASDARRTNIEIQATAGGAKLDGLAVAAQPGSLGPLELDRRRGTLEGRGVLRDLDLPTEQPSFVLVVAATGSPQGFSARTGGAAVEAPIKVAVDAPAGAVLSIEGASNKPAPVTASAEGKAVITGVLLRYGAAVHAFLKTGGKKTEVPIVVPASLSPGLVLAIPGQAFADGGTGPTLVLAVPPSPFGGEPIWPEVKIEGLQVAGTVKLAADVRVLTLRRPDRPGRVSVILDGEPAGFVDFSARRGEHLALATERWDTGHPAIEVQVSDALGQPADTPEPRAFIEGGAELTLRRSSTGRYRAQLPPSVAPAGVTEPAATVVAELPPLPVLAGPPLEPQRVSALVSLPPAAPAATATAADTNPRGAPLQLGVAALGSIGGSFDGLLAAGGGVSAEMRLPDALRRVAVRLGAEFSAMTASGVILVDGQPQPRQTTIAGVLVPADVGFVILDEAPFELVARAGAAVRIETGSLSVAGISLGSASRIAVGGRVSADAGLRLGIGSLILAAMLDGIGSSADFARVDPQSSFSLSGSLLNLRGVVGYRIWFVGP